MDIVTIHPGFVLGPVLSQRTDATSVTKFKASAYWNFPTSIWRCQHTGQLWWQGLPLEKGRCKQASRHAWHLCDLHDWYDGSRHCRALSIPGYFMVLRIYTGNGTFHELDSCRVVGQLRSNLLNLTAS